MMAQFFPTIIEDIRFGTEANSATSFSVEASPISGLPLQPPPLGDREYAVADRFSPVADIVFAPVISQEGRGQILLKRVWFRFSKVGSPTPATLKVYIKGNYPQWGNDDAPDFVQPFSLKSGNVILNVNVPPSEAYIVRLVWDIDVRMGGVAYNNGMALETEEYVRNRVRLLFAMVEIEEYGDKDNVWGEF
jgi:hypothetical protein